MKTIISVFVLFLLSQATPVEPEKSPEPIDPVTALKAENTMLQRILSGLRQENQELRQQLDATRTRLAKAEATLQQAGIALEADEPEAENAIASSDEKTTQRLRVLKLKDFLTILDPIAQPYRQAENSIKREEALDVVKTSVANKTQNIILVMDLFVGDVSMAGDEVAELRMNSTANGGFTLVGSKDFTINPIRRVKIPMNRTAAASLKKGDPITIRGQVLNGKPDESKDDTVFLGNLSLNSGGSILSLYIQNTTCTIKAKVYRVVGASQH